MSIYILPLIILETKILDCQWHASRGPDQHKWQSLNQAPNLTSQKTELRSLSSNTSIAMLELSLQLSVCFSVTSISIFDADILDVPGTTDKFLCDNRILIPMQFTCDGLNDCEDASDEAVDYCGEFVAMMMLLSCEELQ